MLQRPRTAIVGAAACVAGLLATGILSHAVAAGRERDAAALAAFAKLRDTKLDPLLAAIVHLADPVPYGLFCAAILVVALVRERPRMALAMAAVLVVAPLTSEILKHLTAQARAHSEYVAEHIANASWPSGHATGAMALALCAVIVAPAALRPLVALAGGLVAIGVGYAVVALVWHFPSDTIGGFLVAAAWALLAVAVLRQRPDAASVRDAEDRQPRDWGAALVIGLFAGGAALAVASVRLRPLTDRLAEHASFLAAAGAIAALGAVLSAALVRSARSS
jgi:membrane-associated phospholipid phosphatase